MTDKQSQVPQHVEHVDPLRAVYVESFIDNPAHNEFLVKGKTALLSIDLQKLDAVPGCGVFEDADNSGVSHEDQKYYFDRLDSLVLPNVRAVQDAFRRHEMEVIHTRIQSLTRDGRDRGKGHKRLNLLAAPGSREAEFVEQVAPLEGGDEIVINKTASGVFSSTNLHYVLKNLGIESLFVVGVYTNECVETTVRDACDLGYLVTIVEDCCATVTPELHAASLATLRDRYARVITHDEAIATINRLVPTSIHR
ncbi:Isochorismatase family protein YecD [Rubripirellula lacrimiformis]|uniref:Isochorismatase family protein YecD n=1 Tax=Rubripirellula lacrimiformis TaxID=1930273 RepID=A0A517NKN9_9BACT|nr:isochorismatase family cysteine hydrolase [Rubripirellula lacrimiformis]QDT07705.1 Isochorismatase family protein YecD [Rubripirellula lacrimiformis]